MHNGYYELNLMYKNDRECLASLFERGEIHKNFASARSLFRQGVTGDLSQNGDWSCFRNALYQGEPCHMSITKFSPIPHRGRLSFDFSGSMKPPR